MVILVNEDTKKQKQVIRYALSTKQLHIVSLKKQKTSYIQTAKYFRDFDISSQVIELPTFPLAFTKCQVII